MQAMQVNKPTTMMFTESAHFNALQIPPDINRLVLRTEFVWSSVHQDHMPSILPDNV